MTQIAIPNTGTIFSTKEQSIKFLQEKHILLPQLLSPSDIERFNHETLQFPSREVRAGLPGVQWEEKTIPLDSDIGRFFSQPTLTSTLQRLLQTSAKIHRCHIWTSEYRNKEFVNPHVDKHGTVQLLVCLKNHCMPNSGTLEMDDNGHRFSYTLKEGDALIFQATQILHWTSPAISTQQENSPCRVVLVARYHFETESLTSKSPTGNSAL
jgi:hypothetical protein